MRRERLIKKIISMAFAILLVAVGVFTAVVKLINPAMPAEMLIRGLGFGAVGAAMLILLKGYDINRSPFDPHPREDGEDKPAQSAEAAARQTADTEDEPRETARAEDAETEKKRRDPNIKKRIPPYPIDPKAPYGSKENPMVVGMPEDSSTLVYDKDRGCWILTDGLGNGWIR